LSFIKSKLVPFKNPNNFEEWVINNFGSRLFKIFFKTYTEKVWGMNCSDISVDWAQQRIKGLSLYGAFINGMKSLLKIKNSNTPKTLIEEFYYPRKGPGMFWETLAEKSQKLGCTTTLDSTVNSLEYDETNERWDLTCVSDGNKISHYKSTHIISTTSIKELTSLLKKIEIETLQLGQKLKYRDFLIVAIVVEDVSAIEDNWIYIHDPDVLVGRIQNYKAWSPEMVPNPSETCYGLEYFCHQNDSLWNQSDEELIELAKDELLKIGLVKFEQIKNGYVVRQEKAYPVYDQTYKKTVDEIKTRLNSEAPNLHLVGRNGMHKYNNQDHSMMTAILTAKNILANKNLFDIWLVNQDAEYHESGASGERYVPSSK